MITPRLRLLPRAMAVSRGLGAEAAPVVGRSRGEDQMANTTSCRRHGSGTDFGAPSRIVLDGSDDPVAGSGADPVKNQTVSWCCWRGLNSDLPLTKGVLYH